MILEACQQNNEGVRSSKHIPSVAHLIPSQKVKNELDPSVDLHGRSIQKIFARIPRATHCPAANKLVAFKLLTSSAVIGPGISDPEPTTAHVWFVILNCATFAAVLSESEIDPPA